MPFKKKRKVSFSPVEEQVDSSSPTKKRAYNKRTTTETAATARPKRSETKTEESVKEKAQVIKKPTSSTPHTLVKRPYNKSKNVNDSKSKSATSTSGQPSSSSSKNQTSLITPKKGRGRPKKVVNDKTSENVIHRESTTPSVEIPFKAPEETEKKRGRGRPKKVANETKPGKGILAVKPKVPSYPRQQTDDYAVADYDEDDLDDSRSYWLMKAEPETRFEKGVDVRFSIDDLRRCPEPEPWDGVRNPGARNNMRAMRKGDYAFFYHSNCKVPGIAGIMEIVKEHSVDETAFDTSHPYYDAKSDPKNPKWDLVHVEFRRKFKDLVGLAELKSHGKPGGALENLQVLKQSRLSVSAVTVKQWKFIMSLVSEGDG